MKTKTKIAKMMAVINDINDENINDPENALENYVYLDRFKKHLDDVMKGLKPDALKQAMEFSDNITNKFGSKITKTSSGGGWDFKNCDTWVAKKGELTLVENGLKNAHQAWEQKMDVVDRDGEVVEIPIRKGGSENFSLVHFE